MDPCSLYILKNVIVSNAISLNALLTQNNFVGFPKYVMVTRNCKKCSGDLTQVLFYMMVAIEFIDW